MIPHIDDVAFGSITVAGDVIGHDIIIRLNGEVKKRKKKLSKQVYGTSHIVSLEEAKHVYEKGARGLVIGSGRSGLVELSEDAARFFRKKECKIVIRPTAELPCPSNSSTSAPASSRRTCKAWCASAAERIT